MMIGQQNIRKQVVDKKLIVVHRMFPNHIRFLLLIRKYLYQEITSLVLFGNVIIQNRIFWTIGEHLYFVYYPIISYQWIKVYRVEIIDIGRISLTH